jgi:hypothetical protein
MKLLISFLTIYLIFSCASKNVDANKNKLSLVGNTIVSPNEIILSDLQDSIKLKINLGFNDLYLTSEITPKTEKNAAMTELNTTGCDTWNLQSSDLEFILEGMKMVEAHEWYAQCYQYPCWYQGQAANLNEEYTIEVNAAGYVLLHSDRITLYFIQKEPSSLFLTPCNCCEVELDETN